VSIRVMTLVWDAAAVPVGRLLLLLALADAANDEGVCWPSVTTLARKCRTSDRTVQRHLRDLEAAGLLAIVERPGTSQLYRIDLDALRAGGCQIVTGGVTQPCHRGGDTALSPEPSLNGQGTVPPSPPASRGGCAAHPARKRGCRACGTSPRAVAAAERDQLRHPLAGTTCATHGTVRNGLGLCSACRADELAPAAL
jgi:DNA-binding transcriptional ArsR family regulator